MGVPDECFVSKVVQPVKIVDVQASQANPITVAQVGEDVRQYSLTSLDEVDNFFSLPTRDQYHCRYMYVNSNDHLLMRCATVDR